MIFLSHNDISNEIYTYFRPITEKLLQEIKHHKFYIFCVITEKSL